MKKFLFPKKEKKLQGKKERKGKKELSSVIAGLRAE